MEFSPSRSLVNVAYFQTYYFNSHTLLVEMKNVMAISENILEVFYKVKHILTIRSIDL